MRGKYLLVIVLLLIVNLCRGSFTAASNSKDTAIQYLELSKNSVENAIGRKLTLKEKIVLLLTKRKIKKELSAILQDTEIDRAKANNNAKWSFICALLSFITPLMIIPAVILKGNASKRRALLNPTSINRLKVVNAIAKFWLVIFYILIGAMILLFIGVSIWFLMTTLKGIS